MDLFKLMGQFKDMQGRMQQMQEELSQRTYSALAGGGAVAVEVNGKMQLTRITLDPAFVSTADVQGLEDLILVATNEAQRKAADAMQLELQKVTGGLNLPFPLPF